MAATKRFGKVDAHVGRRVRERRLALGLSQDKLGNALGISFQQVQKYEVGTNRVAAGRLWDMAKILEVDVGYFFEGIERRAKRPRKAKPRKSPTAAKAVRRKGRSARKITSRGTVGATPR